jgi:hypothetical protein
MKIPRITLMLFPGLLLTTLLSACTEAPPVKEAEAQTTPGKSIQEIAAEAMRSKGKLTKEEVNALIAANAKCTPDNSH